ncbi:MAG: nucleotidyl transferase AbiEii/AbiGii toxin family protein [Erysipelotrichaceae bacterium]|nr:nucleotidyl transferase AbiEii/AbiGii toxin family protein [Erysipelotrichaceae bacterium]
MSSRAMSLKARIRNYAKQNKLTAQVVQQNYMFERFLARLSVSGYRDRFVIKGGILIASIVGLDTRSTMDLDATLRDLPLTEENVLKAVKEIGAVDLHDGVFFEEKSISPIRKDDVYGGFCVRIDAVYDTIITPLSIDISTGDIITPGAELYELTGIFDEEPRILLWGYNIETILAEKAESVLNRGIYNTRIRDYYDLYILTTTRRFDRQVFEEALAATAKHRGSGDNIRDRRSILDSIAASSDLRKMWEKYRQRFAYAKDIEFDEILKALDDLFLESSRKKPE